MSSRRPLPLILLSLYFVTKPFYLLSGGAQIADFLIVGLAFLVFVTDKIRLDPASRETVLYGTLFLTYLTTANIVWALPGGGDQALVRSFRPAATSMVNLAILILITHLYQKYRDLLLKYIIYAGALSIFVQVVVSLTFADISGDAGDQGLFFREQNQLAYWTLLLGSMFLLCSTRIRISPLLQLGYSVSILYLMVLSGSRAGLIAVGVLFAVALLKKPPRYVFPAVVIACGCLLLGADRILEPFISYPVVQERLQSRAFDPVWRHPELLILGAGEKANSQGEIHSTFGALLFSYGILGSALFAFFVWRICGIAGAYHSAFLLPAFVFCLTHHGLRFSLVWVLFALTASIRRDSRAIRPQSRHAAALAHPRGAEASTS